MPRNRRPSSKRGNQNRYHFVVVNDPAKRSTIGALYQRIFTKSFRERGDVSSSDSTRYGSILPAVWSLMLALRTRGLGAAWTTLHLYHETEVAALLGIPNDVTQVALLPVAYYTGIDFRPAQRIPSRERTYWNAWRNTASAGG